MPSPTVISVLARSFLAGTQVIEDVHARALRTLGRSWRWLRPLASRYVGAFAGGTRPRHRDVVQFLLQDPEFQRARARYRGEIRISEWMLEPPRMQPVAVASTWDVPIIESVGDLAAWLSLSTDELEWFADLKGFGYELYKSKLQHYHYCILLK